MRPDSHPPGSDSSGVSALADADAAAESPTSVLFHGDLRSKPAPGASPGTETPPPAGLPSLGHFEVLETIGRGGFGVVVRAFDQKLQRVVAIKLMSAEMAATSPARKRFVREARSAAAVRHENVVQVYAVEESPLPHLVMEFVPGGSLQRHIDRTGPLDVREVLRLGAQIARGLAAAHEKGLVHRDIKPANVLLELGGQPRAKLTDFGIAQAADDASLTQSGVVLGTPMYMAPEQAKGERVDHRADLFSLGSVLYVMISGRPPFRASNGLAVLKRVSEEAPRPIAEIIPETPRWLCEIIARLHAKDPADRYQSAAEVADLLERCLGELQRGTAVDLAAAHPARRVRRWPTAALTGLLACAAAVAGSAALHQPSNPAPPSDPPAEPTPPPAAGPADGYKNASGMEFVRVPAGKSRLGGGGGVAGAREVELAYDFYIGKYEVTREEWEKVMGPGTARSEFSPGGARRGAVAGIPDQELPRFPVDGVSWYECRAFVSKLNERVKETGWVYRLPLSTEWEYACRNGPGRSAEHLGADFYAAEPSTALHHGRMNLAGGLDRPYQVGSFPPNALGVHDMQGNVFEWLDDLGGDGGDARLLAGGFWRDDAQFSRAGFRGWCLPDAHPTGSGLRVVRVPADRAATPRQLVEAVADDLRRLNPGFTGQVVPTITDDRVTGLSLTDGTGVKDFAPLRVLRDLRSFVAWNTAVTDLGPLKGLPLRELTLNNVWDLHDLTPLKGMPLEVLEVWGFQGTDLSPLEGMPLRVLNCGGGRKKFDLAPLKGARLTFLCVNCTEVDDLTPLKGMPLVELLVQETAVRDLSPVRGMKLRKLHCRGVPADRDILKDMPLEDLCGDFELGRESDTEFLRSYPLLRLINDRPAAEFWKDADKQ